MMEMFLLGFGSSSLVCSASVRLPPPHLCGYPWAFVRLPPCGVCTGWFGVGRLWRCGVGW